MPSLLLDPDAARLKVISINDPGRRRTCKTVGLVARFVVATRFAQAGTLLAADIVLIAIVGTAVAMALAANARTGRRFVVRKILVMAARLLDEQARKLRRAACWLWTVNIPRFSSAA